MFPSLNKCVFSLWLRKAKAYSNESKPWAQRHYVIQMNHILLYLVIYIINIIKNIAIEQ